MYGVILAGGSGKRLWPLSRRSTPKQLLDITGRQQHLLRETFVRLEPLIPADAVYVITAEQYLESTREQLPRVPMANILIEPEGRGSAPAIGLAAMHLKHRDPEAVMACLPADHYIGQPERFRQVLSVADAVARKGHLVTLGMNPRQPHTGYGYIETGERLEHIDEYAVYNVRRFTEKPDAETATRFVNDGCHFWNSGMFIWQASVILEEMARHLPRLSACLTELEGVLGTEEEGEVLERTWPDVEKETIDFGVMEKARGVVVIPAEIGWSDVGSWASLGDLLPADSQGNVVVGSHLGLETTGSLIYSPKRLVATVGVEDLIVVETDDVILVCPRNRAEDVKALVDKLEKEGPDRCL
jgi:mannose-1-phosphate guanylyltransferase